MIVRTMALINDITLGQYYPADSFVHRLDPRSKLVASLLAMSAMLLSYEPLLIIMYIIILGAGIGSSRLPMGLVVRNLRPFIWLFLLTMFIHGFFTEGEPLINLPVFNAQVTMEGFEKGLLYSIRLALLIVFAALLTLTTSPIEMTDGLELLLSPAKKIRVPTHELTMMMTLAMRFIPTLLIEADKLKKAQMARGAVFEGNIVQRVRSIIPLLLPLFISSFRRADELALAMDARCYAGGEGRTTYKILRFKSADYFIIFGAALLVPLAIIL